MTVGLLIVIGAIAVFGRKSPTGNDWQNVLPASDVFGTSTQDKSVDDDKYTTFYFEVYDLIENKYWTALNDEQLGNITKLAIEKITGEPVSTTPTTRNQVRSLVKETMKDMSDDKKKDFTVKLSQIVVANLDAFTNLKFNVSRLITSEKRKELADTVNNVNPNVNHYDVLGINKDASPEDISNAYQSKKSKLQSEPQTPETQKELAQVDKAYEVLGNKGNKEVYDQAGADPTIENRLISPRIFYIHITKFSPTTVQEIQRVMDKVDQGDQLDTLIVDLRGNVGGAIDGLSYFLGPFIGPNQYAYQFFSRGQKQDFVTKTGWMPSMVRYKKVVILIDDKVQSSAEVFAASLKKYNVGVLVGVPTKGWGTVESVFKINNQLDPDNEEYSVLLVHSLTLRDDGVPVEGKGVEPNVNINDANWQQELYKYFNSQEIVNAVANLEAK